MKKAPFTLLAALALPLLANETIEGQKRLQASLVTWTSGVSSGKTRILYRTNNVYLDTSTTGQTGQWKRIDNTADSCSQPFLLTSDTAGTTAPVWMSPLVWETVYAVSVDSSTHAHRIQTRERQYLGPIVGKRIAGWTPWTRKGTVTGYANVTVQDSVLFPSLRTGWGARTKASQYAMANVFGVQGRLCPDDVPETSNDSVIVDSIRVYTR